MDKARILVVEDESLLAEDIQERLKNLGYEVAAVAHSGEEALAGVAAAQPDLVLMDIRLKGKMDLAWLEKKLAEASHLPSLRTVRKMTRHMPEVVDEIISAIRKIATELRPGVLDDLGLRIPLARSGETTST